MNTNDLNTALYEKMAAEQDKYRDWLKSQPPEEILHHTYEYTVREDIVMAMEELELTDAQAQALLESPSPLADVYRYFEKLETGYMDVIRDSIENRADDVCRAQRGTANNTGLSPFCLPMRPSMGRWHSTTSHIRRTAPAKKPLNRPSAPTMQRTGWIRRRRSKMCWKSSGRNGYSSFLPTPSSTRTMTGVSLKTIKPGQKPFPCRRTAMLPATVPIWLWMGSIPV